VLPQLRHILFWDADVPVAWATSGLGASLDRDPDARTLAVVRAMEDDVTPADPMLITYTSGSTGEPKGVVHGNGPLLRHARNLAAMSGIGADDRIWTPMPLCWVGGFSFTLLRALSVGGAFVTQDRMAADVALRLLEQERVSCVSAWPSIGATLTAHPDFPTTDLSALRLGTFYEGRSPDCRPADPGLSVTSLGMSETGGPHTFWTLEEDLHGSPEEYRGSFGHEVPGVAHRIVDAEGNDVPEGTEGEVLVRGYSVMLGLHKVERGEVFDADGWLHTGDLGEIDERGCLRLTGRATDMYIRGGYNVHPGEVEAVLLSHPAVAQVAVVARPDEVLGEIGVAVVVPRDPSSPPTLEDLRSFGADGLASYKLPEALVLRDSLPLTTMDKLDRRRLGAEVARSSRSA
jgi:acyl-CoA synthetase (AMP-forming)/AMP-acid ligase II